MALMAGRLVEVNSAYCDYLARRRRTLAHRTASITLATYERESLVNAGGGDVVHTRKKSWTAELIATTSDRSVAEICTSSLLTLTTT